MTTPSPAPAPSPGTAAPPDPRAVLGASRVQLPGPGSTDLGSLAAERPDLALPLTLTFDYREVAADAGRLASLVAFLALNQDRTALSSGASHGTPTPTSVPPAPTQAPTPAPAPNPAPPPGTP